MIRKAKIDDLTIITELALKLWPDNEFDELMEEFKNILLDKNAIIFLSYVENIPVGFAQCELRFDYVEGTESSPVAYLEGIFVDESYRKQGIASKLLESCELWGKQRGCTEFASDCELDNTDSLKFHLKLGFEEVNRIICFKKSL